MRRGTFMLLLALLSVGFELSAQKVWYNPQDAEINPVEGQFWQGEERANFYNRMPDRFKAEVREAVWKLSTNCAGELVVFRTDSPHIVVRYQRTQPDLSYPHMPLTGSSGVDLYATNGVGENFRVVGRYNFADTCVYRFADIAYRKPCRKGGYEYRLYLPPYNGVKWLEIGAEEGSQFEFMTPRTKRPIVIYGTSIAQGACASRPGMIWSSIVSRELDRLIYNFGFSGNGRLEDELIDAICEIDAEVYVLDCIPNLSLMSREELLPLIVRQVKRIRERRPKTPILLVDHLSYPDATTNDQVEQRIAQLAEIQKAAYEELLGEGVKRLYHLDNETLAIPYSGIVDYVHPSDYGMVCYGEAYVKALREILGK